MYVLSQIFVVISGILFAASYLTKNKAFLLLLNIFNTLFFGLHYIFLKSFTAAYSILLTILFFISIYAMQKYKKEKFSWLSVGLCSVALIPITIFTWSGPLSLAPTISVFITFVGSVFKNTLYVKIYYFISTTINTVFMFIINSYFGFAVNICILITAIIGIIQEIKYKNLLNSKKV